MPSCTPERSTRVAAVHPRFQTPYVAIAIAAALGAGFVLLRTFEQLADTFVTAIVPFYALAVASIFVVRKRGAVANHTLNEEWQVQDRSEHSGTNHKHGDGRNQKGN